MLSDLDKGNIENVRSWLVVILELALKTSDPDALDSEAIMLGPGEPGLED